MFLLNEMLVFTPGRRQEALDRLAYIHGLMARQDGFVEAVVAKYLGDGLTHTVLRAWRDEAAYQTFRAGPDGNYGRNRPEGLYTNQPVTAQWNSIRAGGSTGRSNGPFLVKFQREVPTEAWVPFEAYMETMQQAMGRLGLVSARHVRAKEGNEALTVARFRSRDAFESMMESPELGAVMVKQPEGVKLTSMGCFEPVAEVGPAR